MKLLRKSSRGISALGLAAGLLGAVAAQQPTEPAPSSQSYDSLVKRPTERAAPVAPRPLLAGGAGAGFAILHGAVYASDGAAWSPRGDLGGEAVAAVATPVAWRCLLRSGRVVASRDGGRTWTAEADLAALAGAPGAALACGGFATDGEGWAALDGAQPALLVTAAGAWRRAGGVRGPVAAGWRGGGVLVAVAGDDVYRGAADGSDLRRVAALQGPPLTDVAFADDQRGWITTANGLVLETHDGGTTWLPRPVAGSPRLEAVGLDGATFWVVGRDGAGGALFVSGDAGVRWRSALTAPGPLSRPVRVGAALWLVDGEGGLWTADALDGAWRRAGSLLAKGQKRAKR